MMDLATIDYLTKQAARRAAKVRKQPQMFDARDLERAAKGDFSGIAGIPNLGSYLPKGWKRVSLKDEEGTHGVYMGDNSGFGAYFVDKSGWGSPGEPAMTVKELARRMKPGLGYAMVEEGQFQVKVGVFKLAATH